MLKSFFKTKSVKKVFHGLLSCFLVMLFTMSVNAQSSVNGKYPAKNSEYVKTAEAYGVVLRPFNSWDVSKVKSVLEQQLAGLSPNSSSQIEKFKFVYYSFILNDLNYSVAPELSVVSQLRTADLKYGGKADIKELSKTRGHDTNLGVTKSDIQGIYNDLVSKF